MKTDKKNLAFPLAWSASLFVTLLALLMFLPSGKFPPGTDVHAVFRVFWWVCGATVLLILSSKHLLRTNFAGSILVMIFGPTTLLALGIVYAAKKFGGNPPATG